MALIVCDECGKQISDKAQHCVHCGAPIVTTSSNNNSEPKRTPIQANDTHDGAVDTIGSPQTERILGIIDDVKTSIMNGKSLAEITVVSANGVKCSTGLKSAKTLRPYTWTKGDNVSYTVLNGQANDLVKLQKTNSQSSKSNTFNENLEEKVVMPKSIQLFERLMLGAVGLGLLFAKVPGQAVGFALGTAAVSILFVLWASRGRSVFAKWFNGIAIIFGTIVMISTLSQASAYGNSLFGNPIYGSSGAVLLLQTLIQLYAGFLLFSPESRIWFAKKVDTI